MNNKDVYIVGGGTSITQKQLDFVKDKDVIAINKSCLSVPNAKYIITLDNTLLNKFNDKEKIDFAYVNGTKIFVVNLGHADLEDLGTQIRDSRHKNIYDFKSFDMIIKSYNQFCIGNSFKDFRCGNNSGYSALQLAVLLGYKNIYLLGIDLLSQEKTHFHNGYKQCRATFECRLDDYYTCFKQGFKYISKNVKVYSCSPISRLNNLIPYKKL